MDKTYRNKKARKAAGFRKAVQFGNADVVFRYEVLAYDGFVIGVAKIRQRQRTEVSPVAKHHTFFQTGPFAVSVTETPI